MANWYQKAEAAGQEKEEARKRERPLFRVTKRVLAEIEATIGRADPETGGILGQAKGSNAIAHFHFDSTGGGDPGRYMADWPRLSTVIQDWKSADIEYVGLVHSHPNHPGAGTYSEGDEKVSGGTLVDLGLDQFYCPIVLPKTANAAYRFLPFIAMLADGRYRLEPCNLEVVEEPTAEPEPEPQVSPEERYKDELGKLKAHREVALSALQDMPEELREDSERAINQAFDERMHDLAKLLIGESD